MEKSKCKTKVAALLVALVIIFIPFGSAFAAMSWCRIEHLCVSDSLGGCARTYNNYCGTYYIRQGDELAFLTGDFVDYKSSFTLTVEIRDTDAERNIRKVTERITVPSFFDHLSLDHFCNIATHRGATSRVCSKEMSAALNLTTLPVGNYSCSFFIDNSSSGVVTYVRVYSGYVDDFVKNAYRTFGLRAPNDLDKTLYKLSKHQIKGTDFLWDLYVKNQASGTFKGASSITAIRNVCKVAYGRSPTAAEEKDLLSYCSRMGLPLTIKKIIYSGKAMDYIESRRMKV